MKKDSINSEAPAATEASRDTKTQLLPDSTKAVITMQPGAADGSELKEHLLQKIISALAHIPPDDRETWIKVGMAIQSELDEEGFDIWDEWSQSVESYDPASIEATWASFNSGGGINIGTIFHLAKENGWDSKRGTPSPLEGKTDQKNNNEGAEFNREEELALKRAECREDSRYIWEQAEPAPEDHPYLVRKKVKPHNLKIYGELLVVPVWDWSGTLHGLQFIAPEKNEAGVDKVFKTGTAKTGHCHTIGGNPDTVIYLAEGFATAASIHEATDKPVVVCFDAGNLKPVAEMLREKLPDIQIVICADNDRQTKGNPGLTKGRKAALAIGGLLAVPAFPDGVVGSDFNDLAAAVGLDEVRRQVEAAQIPIEDQIIKQRVTVVDAESFLMHQFAPREAILAPWLPTQGLAMVYGPRGTGKTHISLGVAYAVASGGCFLKWAAEKPRGVLFLDGEMPGKVLQDRLSVIAASHKTAPSAPFKIITPDLQPGRMLDLSTVEDQYLIAEHLEGIDLIIADNIATLCRSGKESEGESWLPVQEWALAQRSAGRSVLFIHHSGKNGAQRGTSRREDVLDTVIALRRPEDYSPDKGACFEIHFEKARGIYGDDTKPVEVMLMAAQDGTQTWAIKDLEQSTSEKVATLLKEGVPQVEIAEVLGITKGAVSKAKQRAKDAGLLKVS